MNALSFEDFSRLALDCYRPPLRSASTYGRVRSTLATLAAMGVQSTSDLTTGLVARFVARRAETVRVNSVIGDLGYLSALCSLAVAEGALRRSPFQGSRRFRLRPEPPAVKRWHPAADVARVLRSLRERSGESWEDHRLYAAVATVAYTGLRRSEALHLHREDYDASAGVLCVVARRRLKTFDSAQPVPVPPGLAEVLDGWVSVAGSSPWLFPGSRLMGPWIGGSPANRPLAQIKAAGRAAGVEGFNWQSLRHSWATAAEGAWGLGEGQIQRVLRHTRPMTQRHYRHVDLENLRRIGERVAF